MEHQDWTPVTIQSAKPVRNNPVARNHNHVAATLAKIEAGEEVKRAKVFSIDSVRTIQDYRRATAKTQREVDQLCSFPAGTVNGFESRKTGPSQRQLQELSRLLKQDLTLD
jgi:hypothetical protein